ncbi:MAG: Dehydrogenase flavoprotein LodB [uncultured Acidimicrobiales bacterium]|uniref:Dehydrogenase flavoprotein LodB n=1 Tax=uncultured Acidimicrobiales bacterium TaxID=310071 RepID=A0A6J4J9H9_9ACTN|nr:MAG: Dehydrogenase flavoprotein LodB [uncultured Acidimicrobiales bacterium]
MVGGGPAGCAAAIVLAGGGAEVAVVERSAYDGIRIGETLPPEVRLVLERLDVWDRFQDDGHTPSPGILAAWGQPEPYANDFIVNPYGCGWRVDRTRFDSMLASGARAAGAVVLSGTAVDRCVRQPDRGWALTVTSGEGSSSLSATFVVDATGRSSSFCRALGSRRVVHDRMVALVRIMSPAVEGAAVDRRALIEATADGWWYSAWLPDGRLVLAFQTDAGTGMRARWDEWLVAAPQTAARAAVARGGEVRVITANSHRSEPVAGDGWLAVGDAAAAHDPICGLGILWALESGVTGAEAIRSSAVARYDVDVRERFERYLTTRTVYYRAESRWPDAPFWRRRHHDAAS